MNQVKRWVRGLWQDEQGDLLQNLGWIVAVSLGSVTVGGLIYNSVKTSAAG